MQITLHRYYNKEALQLNSDDIASMERHTAADDAKWGHIFDAQPYTAIKLKDGQKTSENVGTAYVSETPEEIAILSAP